MRRVAQAPPHAWLVADRAGDPVAFGKTHAFCLPSGGYVWRRGDSVYHFPLSAVDLQTGSEQRCVLHVPFKRKLPAPTTNFSSRTSRTGQAIRARGPYLLAVTHLRLDSNTLQITLGMEKWSATAHFDLSKVDSLRTAPERNRETDVKEWIKSLGNVNKRDDDGNTPLLDASGDVDPRYVKALLAAGADVKARTNTAWTPLMYAACYGTAEVVQLLIDAGSDVNARDNNCGGQTVLMWAAGGLREQKKKVHALLEAGADPRATLKTGWTVLMSAASAGQLPTVEVLLGAGLDVNAKTKEGKTALMVAAGQDKSAALVSVLLKAGADIKARDNKGRTPLMYAAEGGSPTNIKALLEAGADVNARDNNGKTALDLAIRNSSYIGSAARIAVLKAAMKAK
jgi:ankyrin repeat protein